jgi:hypothetical protein
MKPIAIKHHAETIDQAVSGAAEQLARALKSATEKAQYSNRHRDR